jgi:hypothetical protein
MISIQFSFVRVLYCCLSDVFCSQMALRSLPSRTPDISSNFLGTPGTSYGLGGLGIPSGDHASPDFLDRGSLAPEQETNGWISASLNVVKGRGMTDEQAIMNRGSNTSLWISPLYPQSQESHMARKYLRGMRLAGAMATPVVVYNTPRLNYLLASEYGRRVFNKRYCGDILEQFKLVGVQLEGMSSEAECELTVATLGRVRMFNVWPGAQNGHSLWYILVWVDPDTDKRKEMAIYARVSKSTRSRFPAVEEKGKEEEEDDEKKRSTKKTGGGGDKKVPTASGDRVIPVFKIGRQYKSLGDMAYSLQGLTKPSEAATESSVITQSKKIGRETMSELRRALQVLATENAKDSKPFCPSVNSVPVRVVADIGKQASKEDTEEELKLKKTAPLNQGHWVLKPYACPGGYHPPRMLYDNEEFHGAKFYVGTFHHAIGPLPDRATIPKIDEYMRGYPGYSHIPEEFPMMCEVQYRV